MKYKVPLFFLAGFAMTALIINSCKKETQNNIETLFTGEQWHLSSLQRTHYVGDTLKYTDTLNTTCPLDQIFTFNADKTCTYTNFTCKEQPTATGTWSLSTDQLFLNSNIACKDSTGGGTTTQPFKTARIVNLGQYSLVLQTGNLETFYPPDRVRTITRYGFVRQKKP
jgi:hypothetical protein